MRALIGKVLLWFIKAAEPKPFDWAEFDRCLKLNETRLCDHLRRSV